jgi:hypothetical protein
MKNKCFLRNKKLDECQDKHKIEFELFEYSVAFFDLIIALQILLKSIPNEENLFESKTKKFEIKYI